MNTKEQPVSTVIAVAHAYTEMTEEELFQLLVSFKEKGIRDVSLMGMCYMLMACDQHEALANGQA